LCPRLLLSCSEALRTAFSTTLVADIIIIIIIIQVFDGKPLLESDNLEEPGVDRRIILKRILKKEEGRV